MKAKDLTGKTFGKLTVIDFSGNKEVNGVSRRVWKCQCSCGNTCKIVGIQLGVNNNSCGCLYLESRTTHGMSKSREYLAWRSMHQRCSNIKGRRFKDWGGRGIIVCKRWDDFENFFSDMGKRPSKDHSVDRKDNDGNYTPENCRWATRSQQQKNRRDRKNGDT